MLLEVGTGNTFERTANNGVSWLQALPVGSFRVTPQFPRKREESEALPNWLFWTADANSSLCWVLFSISRLLIQSIQNSTSLPSGHPADCFPHSHPLPPHASFLLSFPPPLWPVTLLPKIPVWCSRCNNYRFRGCFLSNPLVPIPL